MAETESRFIDTSDLRVHALVAGEGGSREPVVFLHGFPQTSYEWRHQLAALAAAGHPCYAPDNRGFGGTDKPGTRITRDLLSGDVRRVLDALQLERVVLVGHDWGGIIAFKAAVDHPDRVSRLALMDTLCTVWSLRDPAAHAAAIQYYRYALPFHRVIADGQATHGERYESLGEPAVAEMWRHPDGLEEHPGFAHFYDYGPEDRHKRFVAPTLWMYGAYLGAAGKVPVNGDPSVPAGNPFVDQFSRYFPDLRVRAVACGHFIPEEAPDYTSEVLLDFAAGRI